MIYQLNSLADGRTWREYSHEDRIVAERDPQAAIKQWHAGVVAEIATIRCRGTTSPAARKKRRLGNLASLLEACTKDPSLWHYDMEQVGKNTYFMLRLWPRPIAPTTAVTKPS